MSGFYAALDVSDKTTSVCVISMKGDIVHECATATTPLAIAAELKPYKRTLKMVGQESGSKAAWLHKELVRKKFPMICLDARAAHGMLSQQRNKTDKNDARALALVVRNGWCAQAYVKSDEALRWRMLVIHRRTLKRKAIAIEVAIRGSLKTLGLSANINGAKRGFQLPKSASDPILLAVVHGMIRARDALIAEAKLLEAMIQKIAKADPVCRRLMTIPGVGPNTALTFKSAIDDPERFASSRNVAAHFGLTPRRFQSGQTDVQGRISRFGDRTTRCALYEAAFVMLHNSKSTCKLRTWGLALLAKKGTRKAVVAVARKLAVTMHRMWITGKHFDDAPA